VRFARRAGADAADDDVAALVARHPDPASLTVVTSDAALADARARGRRRGRRRRGFLRRLDDAE
jgi:hypothetical protein